MELKSETGKEVVQYEGGSIREDVPGKGCYNYISPVGLRRLAQRCEYGDRKYHVKDDYKKGLPTSKALNSALRHLNQYMAGDNSEDHLAACVWNCFCIMEMEVNNPKWQDIECRKKFRKSCKDYSQGEIK